MKVSHPIKTDLEIPDRDPEEGWKYPTGRFDWPKPFALQWGHWDDWKTEFKSKYPIRFFFYETLPDLWDDIWRYGIHRFFHNLKWKILHRYYPRHQYHIVRTRLEPGYYDPDTQIFEATFALLCEYVEKNIKWQTINWESDEPHSEAWKEMNELVHWYKEIYPNREEEFEKQRPEPRVDFKRSMDEKFKDEPDVIAHKEFRNEWWEKEKEWAEEDEAMLIRVIKLRPFLWYA